MKAPPSYARARANSGRISILTWWGQAEWQARNYDAARRLWATAERSLPKLYSLGRTDLAYERAGGVSLMFTWALCELSGKIDPTARAAEVLTRALAMCPTDERLLLLQLKVCSQSVSSDFASADISETVL